MFDEGNANRSRRELDWVMHQISDADEPSTEFQKFLPEASLKIGLPLRYGKAKLLDEHRQYFRVCQ